MKQKKKHVKESKHIREIQYSKDYKDASPYFDHMNSLQRSDRLDDYSEFPEANPDVLPESAGLYYHHPQLDDELLEQIEAVLPKLSDKQRQVLQMVGYEGKTLENVGALMGISKGNVSDLLKRARKIIKQELSRTFRA